MSFLRSILLPSNRSKSCAAPESAVNHIRTIFLFFFSKCIHFAHALWRAKKPMVRLRDACGHQCGPKGMPRRSSQANHNEATGTPSVPAHRRVPAGCLSQQPWRSPRKWNGSQDERTKQLCCRETPPSREIYLATELAPVRATGLEGRAIISLNGLKFLSLRFSL